jgi:hypothetical protein
MKKFIMIIEIKDGKIKSTTKTVGMSGLEILAVLEIKGQDILDQIMGKTDSDKCVEFIRKREI